MSFRMTNWAYTHSLKTGPKLLLVTIADKAHDDGTTPAGLEYLSYETDIPLSTLKRYMRQLREMDLLHTERREYKGFGGRLTNLIVLHPWVEGTKLSWYDYQKLRAQAAVTEREFGTEVPVENSESTQGINLIPSSNSREDAQSINLIPSAYKVSNEATQGINSDISEGGTLKERARGLNHQLINHQSVSQSVNNSGAVENFDGPTDGQTKLEKENSNPQQPLAPAPEEPGSPTPRTAAYSVTMTQGQQNGQEAHTSAATKPVPAHDRSQRLKQPSAASSVGSGGLVPARSGYAPQRDGNGFEHRGVDIPRVVSTLTQSGMPQVRQVPQQTLVRMIDLVLDRATGVVHSPNGFATAALRNDWFELFSRVEAHQQVRSSAAFGSGGALCRQHRCRLSPAGECKRCVAEQRDTELDELHHELVWKKNLTQIDVATLEISLRRAGYAVEQLPVQYFGQHITAALNSGVAPTNNDLFRYFADNQEIFTHNAASDKEFAGFGHERTA